MRKGVVGRSAFEGLSTNYLFVFVPLDIAASAASAADDDEDPAMNCSHHTNLNKSICAIHPLQSDMLKAKYNTQKRRCKTAKKTQEPIWQDIVCEPVSRRKTDKLEEDERSTGWRETHNNEDKHHFCYSCTAHLAGSGSVFIDFFFSCLAHSNVVCPSLKSTAIMWICIHKCGSAIFLEEFGIAI